MKPTNPLKGLYIQLRVPRTRKALFELRLTGGSPYPHGVASAANEIDKALRLLYPEYNHLIAQRARESESRYTGHEHPFIW